jgi:hypothetical protein
MPAFSSLRVRLILLVLLAAVPALGLILCAGITRRCPAVLDAKACAMDMAGHAWGMEQRVAGDARWDSWG